MSDSGVASIFLQNLPVMVVVIPLLLSAIVAVVPVPRLAWMLALAGVGGSFLENI